MSVPVTPNLGLYLPPSGQYDSSNPLWSQLLNQNFQTIDQKLGIPLTPSRMNINADLPFNGYSATDLLTTQFRDLAATLGGSILRALYSVNGDVWWNNGSGTPVQITSGPNLATSASSGTIGGIPSTPAGAGVSYSNVNGYTLLGYGGNFYAGMRSGPLSVFDTAVGPAANGVTLASPPGLVSSYQIILPAALPGPGDVLPLVGTHAGNVGFQALTRAQLAPQTPALLALTAGWVGTVYYWQDQTGMVHLVGNVQRNSGAAIYPVTVPIAPALVGSVTVTVPVFNIIDAIAGYAYVLASGRVEIQGVITNGKTYSLYAVAYLGAN